MASRQLLYGAYGAGNLGDDLILEAALQKYQNVHNIACFGTPRVTTSVPITDAEDIDLLSSKIEQNTDLIFAGGGQFWSADHIIQMFRLAVRAKMSGAQVILSALGAQGAELAPGLVKDLCTMADAVSVRDHQSKELLTTVGVNPSLIQVVPDLVLSLPVAPKRNDHEIPVIGIAQGDGNFYFNEKWRRHVLVTYRLLVDALGKDVIFRYIPHVRHFRAVQESCIIAGEEIRVFSNDIIAPFPFPERAVDLLKLYSECDLIIANSRYHAAVIAMMLKIPSITLYSENRSKYKAFADDNKTDAICLADHSHVVAAEIIEKIRGLLWSKG